LRSCRRSSWGRIGERRGRSSGGASQLDAGRWAAGVGRADRCRACGRGRRRQEAEAKAMTTTGRVLLAGGLGLGTLWLVRRLVDTGLKRPARPSEAELEPWEREALDVGDVGLPEGHDPAGIDEVPVGRGSPADYCITLAAGEGDDDTAPHCVLDPLSDPRFAPVDRGAPQAAGEPSNSTWPVLTSHRSRLVVSYWTQGGVRGYSGRAFAAKRMDNDGPRKHAGIDLFANDGDIV